MVLLITPNSYSSTWTLQTILVLHMEISSDGCAGTLTCSSRILELGGRNHGGDNSSKVPSDGVLSDVP